MNITYTQSSPYATLLYVVPLDIFNPHNEIDVTALHVLEHWILEGAGDMPDSAAVFKAARKLGGNISAAVSRKALTIKLTYLAAFKIEAVQLLNSVAKKPLLRQSSFQAQIDEVADELQHDGWLTVLFDQYYAATFNDRYALSGGGTTDAVGLVTEAAVRAYAKNFKSAPAQTFWAGPTGYEPKIFEHLAADLQDIKPAELKLGRSKFYSDDGRFALLGVDVDRGIDWLYGLDTFIEVEFGNYASLRMHRLPGTILAGVSYDIPELSLADVVAAIKHYSNMNITERAQYKILANAVNEDMMANSSLAANNFFENWLNDLPNTSFT